MECNNIIRLYIPYYSNNLSLFIGLTAKKKWELKKKKEQAFSATTEW